jgi:hypothetical protein
LHGLHVPIAVAPSGLFSVPALPRVISREKNVRNRRVGTDMTAYLLKDDRREFASHDVYDAWEGFQDLGENVIPFTEAMLRNGVMGNQPGDVVCGWVRTVMQAFDSLGVTAPRPIDYPRELTGWLLRKIESDTLGNLTARTSPVFVKPADQVKLFDGCVVYPGQGFGTKFAASTRIWVSEVVDWRSEWRIYVSGGTVIGAYPYRGDWRVSPRWAVVDDIVGSFTSAPCGYALDIGVMADGRTALIEANDAWALGNYGLLPKEYSRLLRRRWDEILGNPAPT